jgi:hypothetical protein
VRSLDLCLIPNFKPLYRLVQAEFKSILLTFTLLRAVNDITIMIFMRVIVEFRSFCKQNTGNCSLDFWGQRSNMESNLLTQIRLQNLAAWEKPGNLVNRVW